MRVMLIDVVLLVAVVLGPGALALALAPAPALDRPLRRPGGRHRGVAR